MLGEFKYLIPVSSGKHAYVRNLTNGKVNHLKTDSDAFADTVIRKCVSVPALQAAHPHPSPLLMHLLLTSSGRWPSTATQETMTTLMILTTMMMVVCPR